MSQSAVIFGGPSPEHDVSIILGLPAARTLAGAGQDVTAVYWTKTGEFFVVDTDLEAIDFADGVPKKSRPVTLRSGGFEGNRAPSSSPTAPSRSTSTSASAATPSSSSRPSSSPCAAPGGRRSWATPTST